VDSRGLDPANQILNPIVVFVGGSHRTVVLAVVTPTCVVAVAALLKFCLLTFQFLFLFRGKDGHSELGTVAHGSRGTVDSMAVHGLFDQSEELGCFFVRHFDDPCFDGFDTHVFVLSFV
jgi:hypothetical protein